jgi:hypothetical protein
VPLENLEMTQRMGIILVPTKKSIVPKKREQHARGNEFLGLRKHLSNRRVVNDVRYRAGAEDHRGGVCVYISVYILRRHDCSSCPSFVSVVKSSHLRQFNDSTHFRGLDGTRQGSIFVQRQMSSRLFVIFEIGL